MTAVGAGVITGVGLALGPGVVEGAGVGAGLDDGVGTKVGAGVALGEGWAECCGVGLGPGVAVGLALGPALGSGLALTTGVLPGDAVGDGLMLASGFGVAPTPSDPDEHPASHNVAAIIARPWRAAGFPVFFATVFRAAHFSQCIARPHHQPTVVVTAPDNPSTMNNVHADSLS